MTDQEEIIFLRQLMQDNADYLSEQFFSFSLDEKRRILLQALRRCSCEITFKKVDGSIRVMPCTLKPQSLPAQEFEIVFETVETATEPAKKPRKENPNTIRVYCLDKEEWRSFRIDNVIALKVLSVD